MIPAPEAVEVEAGSKTADKVRAVDVLDKVDEVEKEPIGLQAKGSEAGAAKPGAEVEEEEEPEEGEAFLEEAIKRAGASIIQDWLNAQAHQENTPVPPSVRRLCRDMGLSGEGFLLVPQMKNLIDQKMNDEQDDWLEDIHLNPELKECVQEMIELLLEAVTGHEKEKEILQEDQKSVRGGEGQRMERETAEEAEMEQLEGEPGLEERSQVPEVSCGARFDLDQLYLLH